MRIQSYRRVRRDDVPGLPDEVYRALEPISDQLEKLTTAMQGNLRFEDNFESETRELEVSHGVAKDISLQKLRRSRAAGAILIEAAAAVASFTSEVRDLGRVRVTVSFVSDPGEPTRVKFVVLGG